MLCSYASLDETKLEELKKLEKKLGKTLIAIDCRDAKMESLNEWEIADIQDLEKKLGVPLVAVKS